MGKAQFPFTLNWQATNPVSIFLPAPGPGQDVAGNSPKSGVIAGVMTSTSTIYSNILGTRQMDGISLEITYTGTPTGTISVLASDSGINFYPLTFSPVLTQPAGSAGGYTVQLDPYDYQYLMVKYVNASGDGTLTIYGQAKAKNV